MAADETVPLTVTPEARDYIARHGLQGPFETMLTRLRTTVPRLLSVEVELPPQYDSGYDVVTILAVVGSREDGRLTAENLWDRWAIATFPPEVLVHFTMSAVEGEGAHGR